LRVQCNENIRYKKIIKIIDMLGSCTVLDTRPGGTGSVGVVFGISTLLGIDL